MSQHNCETVEVQMNPCPQNPTGVVIINKADFIESVHRLVGAPVPKEVKPKPVPIVAPAVVAPIVTTFAPKV